MPGPDVLSQLLATSLRGIQFPTILVSAEGGHRLANHERQDRDGTFVENAGRNGYVYDLKAPFLNTIARGPTESWNGLFPTVYRQVLAALEDRSTARFVHPTYGIRLVKVVSWKDVLDPDFRGGPVLTLQLRETVDDANASAVAVAQTAPIPIAAAAAISLDATFHGLSPYPFTGTPGGMSLGDFVSSLGGIADQVQLFEQQQLGKINRVVAAMSNLADTYSSLGAKLSSTAIASAADATQRLISSLRAVAATAAQRPKPVAIYVTPARTTLAQIANRTGNQVADLLSLNPGLARQVVVPALTAVSYYSYYATAP